MQTSIASWLTKPVTTKQRSDTVALDETLPSVQTSSAPQPARLTESSLPIQDITPQSIGTQLESLHDKPTKPFANDPQRPLPPQASISPITSDIIPSFRRLNSLLLPIPYQDKFFKETVEDQIIASISRAALWTSDGAKPRLVGAIRCRLLASPTPAVGPSLYISTIGTLAPYRSHGLATALLDDVMRRAIETYGISSVSAHVWAANTEGLEWYAKRGFKEVGRQEQYYKRLDPSSAIMIRRDISVIDLLPP